MYWFAVMNPLYYVITLQRLCECCQSSCYVNDRFIVDSDIVASNGLIHVIAGPLQAPPPAQKLVSPHLSYQSHSHR